MSERDEMQQVRKTENEQALQDADRRVAFKDQLTRAAARRRLGITNGNTS